jgi:hypothetical protein
MGPYRKARLRKEFMKRLTRATMILLLPITTIASVDTLAQPRGPEKEKAADSASAASGVETVFFAEAKNHVDLVKSYPFLKGIIDDVKKTDAVVGKQIPTQIFVATVNEKERKIQLLFVHIKGLTYCGSMGCSLKIFANEGGGYKKAVDVIVDGPIAISKDHGKLSLLFCTDQGRSEWVFQNHSFEYQGPFTDLNQSPPACKNA